MDVGRVVDDKGAVPHHGEVDGEVADVGALVVVLRRENRTVYTWRISSNLHSDAAINPYFRDAQ